MNLSKTENYLVGALCNQPILKYLNNYLLYVLTYCFKLI